MSIVLMYPIKIFKLILLSIILCHSICMTYADEKANLDDTIPHNSNSQASKIRELSTINGVRENSLIGYGLVVGLKGTGDSSTDVTSQSLGRLFQKLGLELQNGAAIKSKNVAAVIVTAKLPAFPRAGNQIDVTAHSIGDSSSLEGGTLLVTPLRAGDQNVYAVAQGPLSIGSLIDGASKNFPTSARLTKGAMIEKDLDSNFAAKKSYRLILNQEDFTTAARVKERVNMELGGKYATARDSRTIDVIVPFDYEGNQIEFLARLENIEVNVSSKLKIAINEKTGTVIMGGDIRISPVAIAHGDLSIEIKGAPKGTKPQRIIEIAGGGSSVNDLVKPLNAIGVGAKELTAILQTLSGMGALKAQLEMM